MSSQEEAIDRLSFISDKLSLLSDVDFADLSHRGAEGIKKLLREMSDEVDDIFEEVHAELIRLKKSEK